MDSAIKEGHVLSNALGNGIQEIEFFHPKHNSLPSHLLAELADAILEAGNNDGIELIILKSGGERTFCAGASFDELISIKDEVQGKNFFSGFANVINACRKCPKLIIGRIQGKTVGGGVGLAAAVDYAIATTFAKVKLSELNIGIGPFVIGPAVVRKMGVSAFSNLSINANEFQSAEWARDHGLFSEVHPTAEAMDASINKLSTFLLNTNPEARIELKKVFWEGTENWDKLLAQRAAQSGRLVLSEQTKKILNKYATT